MDISNLYFYLLQLINLLLVYYFLLYLLYVLPLTKGEYYLYPKLLGFGILGID